LPKNISVHGPRLCPLPLPPVPPRIRPLKWASRRAEWPCMANREIACPICDADIPLAGDEKSGEDVFCTVCGATIVLKGNPGDEDFEIEEDF